MLGAAAASARPPSSATRPRPALHGFDRASTDAVEFSDAARARRTLTARSACTPRATSATIDRVTIDGFRCTSATRTIIDLARARIPKVRLEAGDRLGGPVGSHGARSSSRRASPSYAGRAGGERARLDELLPDTIRSLHERRSVVGGVDRQHTHVPPPRERHRRQLRPPDRDDGGAVGELGDDPVDRRVPLDLLDRRPRAAIGSALVSIRAHSHHNGPHVGWRSTMRRQATTNPAVSSPSPRSAPAVPRTNDSASAPRALATYRSRSMGCTHSPYRRAPCYRRSPWRRTHRWTSCSPRSAVSPGPSRVVDDVPPRLRRARSVHQRELVDPAHGDAHPRGPARLGRPGQLPRHRRRRRQPHVPRPAHRAVPRVHRPRPRRASRHSA